jgi:starch phosphorylase
MKVQPIGTFEVVPAIPEELSQLRTFAFDFRWTWNRDLETLFRDIDPELWSRTGHNPVRVLRQVSAERLFALAKDPQYLELYRRCVADVNRYSNAPTWYEGLCGSCPKNEIVYFSMEYGINENLPIYSGGLGVLSGDHLKSSSDLGVPLVGVGLAYRQGYFQQQLTADGYQTELFPLNDFEQLAVSPVVDEQGRRVVVELPFPGRTLRVSAWKVQVGRVPLILLDTDVPENEPADRRITHMLYGGDKETRIQQEIVLGMGGVEMVKRLNYEVTVCHMNEGHSAFIQFARVIQAMKEQNLTAAEAFQLVAAGTVFTTHTPVPAGIDQFPAELMDKYFTPVYSALGMSRDDVLGLGSRDPGGSGQFFNMAIFALRTANYANGVSRLHADVSRNLWKESFPLLPYDEIPIDYITNGIHLESWLSEEMGVLFSKHIGAEWCQAPDHKHAWSNVKEIPDEELWEVRNRSRERLVNFTRRRVAEYRARTLGVETPPRELAAILDPAILTIGFARRFATYKRATLLLRYPDRLLALLRSKERPIQIIFAGKAHPQDDAGKALIHDILYFARSEKVEHRLVFIENYGMGVARDLVQGVDVWLNTPRRPLEASGTSGMKVLGNGGLNLSILDGWWDEAYEPGVGWAIGGERILNDERAQDDGDAQSLYAQLENQIIPLFYEREHGIPRAWLTQVKNSIASLAPRFNTHRMLKEYCEEYYIPALFRCHRLASDGKAAVKNLTEWKARVRQGWPNISFESVKSEALKTGPHGLEMNIEAHVNLGQLAPGDVEAQLYYGPLAPDGTIQHAGLVTLESIPSSNGAIFKGAAVIPQSGKYGFTVRVIPSHPYLDQPLKMGLVRWADLPAR